MTPHMLLLRRAQVTRFTKLAAILRWRSESGMVA